MLVVCFIRHDGFIDTFEHTTNVTIHIYGLYTWLQLHCSYALAYKLHGKIQVATGYYCAITCDFMSNPSKHHQILCMYIPVIPVHWY